MAVKKETNWYVRAGGAETNGGGYDVTNYPGGTNYADQDAAQVVFSAGNANQLSTSGANATTLTSAGTPFTSQMVGNCVRISAGTNLTTGYYFITTFTDSSNVVLDRTPSPSGAGSVGNGSLGGAHASLINYSNGGGGAAPALTTPLIAGNTINLRGAGSGDPAVGSPDYSYAAGAYWTFPAGDATNGFISLIGYNGRPEIKSDLLVHTTNGWKFRNLKWIWVASPSFPTTGLISNASGGAVSNCIFDQNGIDGVCINARDASAIYRNEFRNTGGGAAGSQPGVLLTSTTQGYGTICENNWIHGLRGDGISVSDAIPGAIRANLIVNNGRNGVLVTNSSSLIRLIHIQNNTIDANGGDGIHYNSALSLIGSYVSNNIISNHTVAAKYGINVATGTASANDLLISIPGGGLMDYNNFYNNTAARNNLNAGANDVALDPQYVSAAGNNYIVGTNMKAIGRPSTAIGAIDNPSATLSYVDLGAAQRQETGGGGSTAKSFTFG